MFQISFQPDWQIEQTDHGAYSNPGTQVEAQNEAFGAVSQRDLNQKLMYVCGAGYPFPKERKKNTLV